MVADQQGSLGDFLNNAADAAGIIQDHVSKGDFVSVISHLDADGLAAAGILGCVLSRLDATFRIRIAKQIDESLASDLASEGAPLYIFSDFGSGSLDIFKEKLCERDIVVLDHHQPINVSLPRVVHVNPHLHGFDGARELAGSGVAYFVARAISHRNIDLAYLAVVGALGDMQDRNKRRELYSLNELVVKDAIEVGALKTEIDLIFYGRETRPLYKALACTTNPFIPGLSGEEDKCLGFLVNLGIDLKVNERWRALSDLSPDEKQKLLSQLVAHLVSRGIAGDVAMTLVGTVYVLTKEDRWTPLRDAREYASLLNACGRMDKAGLGVAICIGGRGKTLDEAQEVLNQYRRTLAQYMDWLTGTPGRLQEIENAYIVRGEGVINERLLGAVSTILTTTGLFQPTKPIIALTTASDGGVKVSARATNQLIREGLNLGVILQIAAGKVGGRGGGHDIAAGAQIAKDSVDDFLAITSQLIKEQLKREK
jgi:RecJ-like exonuclease